MAGDEMNIKKLKMYLVLVTNALMRRKLRMFIALLAVAIGATIISGMMTVYKEVPEQMGREFRAYGANLLLIPADGKKTFDQSKLAEIYKLLDKKELVGASPFLYERLKINESPVLTGGTDFDVLKKVSPYWQIEGKMPKKGSKEILLGNDIAQKYCSKIGDTLIVSTHDGNVEEKFTVSGIVRTGGKEEQFAYVDLPILQQMTEKEGQVSVVQVSVVADESKLQAFENKLHSQDKEVQSQIVKQIAGSEAAVLAKLQALVLLVTLVVLLLTLVCVGTTMTEVVSERRKEIGLKKALGASNKNIAFEFLGESGMLGLFGGIAGTACGYIFAQAVGMNVFGREIGFSFSVAIFSIIISILITSLASLIPVRTAVKIEPAIVLRGE